MKTLSKFFITNSKLTLVLSFFLIFAGGMGLYKINSESFPSVDFAMAIVTTQYRGASAEDIETKITKPIEDQLRTVTGIKDIRSVSQAGTSTIFIRADIDNIVVSEVMSDLQKAVDRVSKLPIDLNERPKFMEIKSEEFPVLQVAITGDNTNRQRDIVSDALKEEIEDNKQVLRVTLSGYKKRQFNIKLDVKKLNDYHIAVSEVLGKIRLRNVNIPGGSLKDHNIQQLIRLEGKISNSKELGDILIRSNHSGQRILLKDLADISDSDKTIKNTSFYNGEEATVMIITKKGGADTIKLVKKLKKKLNFFKDRYKDKLEFHTYLNESIRVEKKLSILSSNAAWGLIFVMMFLFIFLPGKVGIAASVSLPLAVLGTFGIMYAVDMNLNAVTILALVIALGMLVDNSVVISENFTRIRQDGIPPIRAAYSSVSQLALPISATAFTTIAAFLPMLVTKGIMGQFIKNIPIIVTASLLLSLIESFFFLPMRLAFFGRNIKSKNDSTFKSDWFQKVIVKFENLMKTLINRRYFVSLVFIAIVTLSLFLMVKVNKFVLFPSEQSDTYMARIEMPIGTRLERTETTVKEISSEIRKILGKDAEHVLGVAGSSSMGFMDHKGSKGNNQANIVIKVSDHIKYNVHHSVILKKLRTINPPQVKSIHFEEQRNGPPVGGAINATFRSNNKKNLDAVVSTLTKELDKIEGINDIKVDDILGNDEVIVTIMYDKADRLGLNIKNIGDTISAAISGKPASSVTLNNKDIDIFLQLKESYRKSLTDLGNLKIIDNRGNLIPLKKVAKFKVIKASPQIKRFDFKRSKTITAGVDDATITAFEANQHFKKIFKTISDKYPDISLVFGGQEESTKESLESLFQALILSLIGIFALLVFLFRSYLRPVIIMTTIPLGLLGFTISFYFHDRPTSFLALIGIIGLGGIIVNSGIVLISFIDKMIEEGKMNLNEALVKASGMRLRAVIVTSLTTISGLLPTAYGIGGSDSMLIPMTLAMAWGLTSGTILTLIWVPCAYAIIEDINVAFCRLLNISTKPNSETDEDNIEPKIIDSKKDEDRVTIN